MGNFDAVYKLSQKRCIKLLHIRVLLHRCDKCFGVDFLLLLLFRLHAQNLCHRFWVALFQLVVVGHFDKPVVGQLLLLPFVLPEQSGTLPKGHWQIICT